MKVKHIHNKRQDKINNRWHMRWNGKILGNIAVAIW